MPDEQLKQWYERKVHALKNDDPGAWREFFNYVQEIVYQRAYRIVQNADDAEDVTSIVLLYLYQRKDQLPKRSDPSYQFYMLMAWILLITRHRAIDWLRKRDRLRETTFITSIYGNENFHADSEVHFRECMNQVKVQQPDAYLVIVGHDLLGYTYKEILEELGISMAVARARRQKGLEFLQNCLRPPSD